MHDRPFLFKINNDGSGPNLLLKVFLERGWKEHTDDGLVKENWNIWWRSGGFPVSQKILRGWQFTNHIPKASCICRKDCLTRYLRIMRQTFGAIYDFSPDSYNLPLDYNKLVEKCSQYASNKEDEIWICKPVGQSQGRGISIFRKMSDLVYGSSSVVQRYVKNPLLIGGYKFDLRLYVCVPSFHPLTVYVYREGLARFSTDKFSLSDLNNRYAHLTNCSLNKQGPGYSEMKERVGAGCKWSLKKLRYYMEQNHHDDWLMWQRIATVIVLTIASQLGGIPYTKNCFEFYGFDILIDSSLKPWLLEVNVSPALCTDCDIDPAVKKPMLHDMFDLLGLPVCNTGLSLFCDWNLSKEFMPPYTEEEEEKCTIRNTAKMAVNVVTMANKWKRHLKPTPPQSAKERRTVKGGQFHKTNITCSKAGPRSANHVKYARKCYKDNESETEVDGSSKCAKDKWPSFQWDNGKDWRYPAAGEGDWVRVYPFFSKGKYWNGQEQYEPPEDKALKHIVASVSRYYKTAKEVFLKTKKHCDDDRDFSLLRMPRFSDAVWHPKR